MTWHYLNEDCEPCTFSPEQAAASSGTSSSATFPSALSNLMPTPAASCLPASETDASPDSPSGMTCEPSTASLGLGASMSSPEGSPAKTSAPQARAPGSTGSALASGPRWPGSFARFDPATSSWRTAQCLLGGGLAEFSETWPRWGSMRDGECWEQTMPALHTRERESGFWPTVRSSDGERGGRGDLIQAVRGNENSHFKRWPMVREQFPTPCSRDWKDSGENTDYEKIRSKSKLAGSAGGMLNPTWVEWLMGWPLGWTELKPSATDKFRQWSRSHGAPSADPDTTRSDR